MTEALDTAPVDPREGVPYASLRVMAEAHKLRLGAGGPKLIEAGPGQDITYLSAPYPHFLVTPSGVEIPLHNVASAIQVGAPIMQKIPRRTGSRTKEREAPIAKPARPSTEPMTEGARARRKAERQAAKRREQANG